MCGMGGNILYYFAFSKKYTQKTYALSRLLTMAIAWNRRAVAAPDGPGGLFGVKLMQALFLKQ